MRPSILVSSLTLIFGLAHSAFAQVVLLQPSWVSAPVFVPAPSFALPAIPVPTEQASNSPSTTTSRYGSTSVIPVPVQVFVATPPKVRLERYYFIPSPMEPIVPPSADSKAVPKESVASPFGEVIIREYFVMDRPVPSNSDGNSSRESTPATTTRNSSQEKPSDVKSGKLDKPKWSDEYDKTETKPGVKEEPMPDTAKEVAPAPSEEAKEPSPPADEKKEPAPTEPIAPAEPPATTPGAST